jgi:hypothetical protein
VQVIIDIVARHTANTSNGSETARTTIIAGKRMFRTKEENRIQMVCVVQAGHDMRIAWHDAGYSICGFRCCFAFLSSGSRIFPACTMSGMQ